jgi:hypothetical protein
MRTIWIMEVRYYKYISFLCLFLILCGLFLLHEYQKQENNIGTIINVIFIRNVSYIIPVYKVQKYQNIYNVYDNCVISNVSTCSNNINIDNIINMIVYFEQVNGFYIILNRNHVPLYFATFALTFSILLLCIILLAYVDFYRLRRTEYKMWSKQKKYDIDFVENNISSFLYD